MRKFLAQFFALLVILALIAPSAIAQTSAYTSIGDNICAADGEAVTSIEEAISQTEKFDCSDNKFNRSAEKLWVRLDVSQLKDRDTASHLVLTLSRQASVTLHSVRRDGVLHSAEFTSQDQARHWHIYDSMALPLPVNSANVDLLILEVERPWDPAGWGGFRLLDMGANQDWLQRQTMIVAGVFGVIFALLILVSGVALVYRKPFAFLYFGLVSSGMLYALSWSGFLFEIFPGLDMQSRSIFNHIITPIPVLLMCCLTYELCEEGIFGRWWKRALLVSGLLPLAISFTVLAAVPAWPLYGSLVLHLSYVLPVSLISVALAYAVYKGSRLGLVQLFGWSGIQFYLAFRIMLGAGIQPPFFFYYFGLLPAFIMEVFVITALVLWNFARIKRDHDDAILQKQVLVGVSETDPLLSIPNRRRFTRRVTKMIDEMPHRRSPLALALIDLDGFKAVNDTYGHAAGDELLKQVVDRLQALVPDTACFARLGGDEFGVAMFAKKGEVAFADLCQRFCEAVKMPFELADGVARIGASIGIAMARPGDATLSDILERADYALYQSKSVSKGRPIAYTDAHDDKIRQKRKIETLFMDADLGSELEVVFQPIVDPETSRPKCMEALARWMSPQAGLISPADFIPIAENNGRINEITLIVISKALEQAKTWPRDISLSINLSPVDILSEEASDRISRAVLASGFPFDRIIFELTESVFIREFERCERTLNRWRELGIRIALDDFGTGYSSLSYLKNTPIDLIKIDRSFIAGIETDQVAKRLLSGIISLCKSIDVECSVEGIERESQRQIAVEEGASTAQGFLFAKPMKAREARDYLVEKGGPRIRLIA